MNKMEFHKQVNELTLKGVLKKEAFEQCYTIDSPFITYSSYRVWKSRNGIKDKSLLKCKKCSNISERNAPNQIYCNKCSKSNGVSNWGKIDTVKKSSDEPELSPLIKNYIIKTKQKEKEVAKLTKELSNAVSNTLSKWKDCESCGEMFKATNKSAKYCSTDCKKMSENMTIRKCSVCSSEFIKSYGKEGNRTECSDTCKDKRMQYTSWDSANKLRCKKYNKKYQYVNKQEIYDRDNNTCYICNKVCDTNLHDGKTYKPDLITLDHVIPLSNTEVIGRTKGHHNVSNLKTCCMSCNTKKGTRI